MILDSWDDIRNSLKGNAFFNIIAYEEKSNSYHFDASYFYEDEDDEFGPMLHRFEHASFFYTYFFLPRFDIEDFEYDVSTGKYTAYDTKVDSNLYENVIIEFNDDKLVSVSYYDVETEQEITVQISNVGETEVTSPHPYEVSSYTFDKYFGLTEETFDNLNITLDYEYSIYKGKIEYDNGLRLDTYVRTDLGNEIIEIFYIDEISTDSIKYNYYVYENGSWGQNYSHTYNFNVFVRDLMLLPKMSFSSLEFNEESLMYEIDEIGSPSSSGTVVLSNVKIKFEDGKLVYYTFEYLDNTYVVNVSNVGTTTVTDPLAGQE